VHVDTLNFIAVNSIHPSLSLSVASNSNSKQSKQASEITITTVAWTNTSSYNNQLLSPITGINYVDLSRSQGLSIAARYHILYIITVVGNSVQIAVPHIYRYGRYIAPNTLKNLNRQK
jgi:hypothetical protein